MKADTTLNIHGIKTIAERCYDLFNSTAIKREALSNISDYVISNIGEYFGPDSLAEPDEVTVNFVELLDQVVFEIKENGPGEGNIRDYILEDLYFRLGIYLDLFKSMDLYKKNFIHRKIAYEDTIIIRKYRLSEYIPDLLREFNGQPALQRQIVWALLPFRTDDLLSFYYQIIKEENSFDVKVLAFLGLKMFNGRFSRWSSFRNQDPEMGKFIDFIENFNMESPENSGLPSNPCSFLFVLSYIENGLQDSPVLFSNNWAMDILILTLKHDFSGFFVNVFLMISNILIFLDTGMLKNFLRDEAYLEKFISILDCLPGEYFNRILKKLSSLGDDFIESGIRLISSKKIGVNQQESNTKRYLSWVTNRII